MRVRRLRKHPAGLDVTAFINLIVVLVPFLLSTTVFSQIAVMDLTLPAQSSGPLQNLSSEKLNLEVVIRADALEVGDRVGGLIQRIEKKPDGHDIAALAELAKAIKLKFPDEKAVTVLPEAAVAYDVLVQVMDAMRAGKQAQGAKLVTVDLFPDISIGDAPLRPQAAKAEKS